MFQAAAAGYTDNMPESTFRWRPRPQAPSILDDDDDDDDDGGDDANDKHDAENDYEGNDHDKDDNEDDADAINIAAR